jgi:sec-independent protein translocase protein TatB
MFDVNFSEMMVIAVVAFIVIGPERLPKVARTLGHLLGRGQRYISSVKADIARDIGIEELRQLQAKVQHEYKAAEDAVNQVTQTLNLHAQEVTQSRSQQVEQAKEGISLQSQLNSGLEADEQPSITEQARLSAVSQKDGDAIPADAGGVISPEQAEFKSLSSAYQEATRSLYAQQEAARVAHVQEEKARQLRETAEPKTDANDQSASKLPHGLVPPSKQAQFELKSPPEQKISSPD